jgi:1,4-dihydroxy-2-naphthoate octaprenyltransferase
MSKSAALSARASRLLAAPRPGRLGAWVYALRTTNPPPGLDPRALDVVTKWLVVTRAAVLPMTVFAGLVAGLLAVRVPGFSWPLFGLALLGITLAHACNNIMNDLSDTDVGLDTEHYPRALYAPHPILSGMVRRKQMGLAVIGLNVACFAIMVVLATQRGWPVVAFAVTGIALSIAYTAPPLRLKGRGLGELDVFVVWGPLMVAGTYFSAAGELPWQIWVASVPYGLLCTTVLMGKHIDKIPYDGPTGTRTLPVVLGERRARSVTLALLVGFYATTGLAVAVGALPWPVLIVAAGLPLLRNVAGALRSPRPDEPPPGFPVWPLWFAAVCFVHTVRAGGLLVLGLGMAAATGTGLPLS